MNAINCILVILLATASLETGCTQKNRQRPTGEAYSIDSEVRRAMEIDKNMSEERRASLERESAAHAIRQNQWIGVQEESLRSKLGEPKMQWWQSVPEARRTTGYAPPGKVRFRTKLKLLFFESQGRDYYFWLANEKGNKWTVVSDYNAVKGTRF